MAIVQAFSRERAFQRDFEELNELNRVANVRAQKLSSVFFPAIELLGVIATVAVLFAGARLIDADSLEIGTLIAAVGLLQLLFQPLQELSELYGQVQAASAAMGKITSVLDAEIDIADQPGAKPLPRIDGRLELDRVTFAYGAEPVLHEIELDVPAGGLHRARRRVGRRQVDDRAADRALLRPGPRRGARRRRRPARRPAPQLPPPARRRPAGPVPLQRHRRRQHPLRPAGRDRRGGAVGRARPSASTGSRRGWTAGSTTSSARAAPGSPRASAS